jgi:hypothetical protein
MCDITIMETPIVTRLRRKRRKAGISRTFLKRTNAIVLQSNPLGL